SINLSEVVASGSDFPTILGQFDGGRLAVHQILGLPSFVEVGLLLSSCLLASRTCYKSDRSGAVELLDTWAVLSAWFSIHVELPSYYLLKCLFNLVGGLLHCLSVSTLMTLGCVVGIVSELSLSLLGHWKWLLRCLVLLALLSGLFRL